jgi:hypothetical protein
MVRNLDIGNNTLLFCDLPLNNEEREWISAVKQLMNVELLVL